MTSPRLTVPEKLLIAALEVRKRSPTFTAEDLVVEAWKQFPDAFGLSGYSRQFPDSNRVFTKIMGTQGMRGKGWLRKVGEKQYQLTSAALKDGENLLRRENNSDYTRSSRFLRAELDRQAAAMLGRVMSTQAARKAFESRIDQISFNDACGFWDITVRSSANTLATQLAEMTTLIERVVAASNADGSEGLKVGSNIVTKEQIRVLEALHRDLQDSFRSDLDIIRRRGDERV